MPFLREFWQLTGEMAPYLLFGLLAAGLLKVFLSPEAVARHLGGRGWREVFKAAIFGIPLPLCCCGVLPTGIALSRQGASRGATVAFLISTPQTGVDSILVTYGMLGPVLAVARPLVALVSGVIGGLLVETLAPGRRIVSPDGGVSLCQVCQDEACLQRHSLGERLGAALRYGFGELLSEIALPLFGGLVIAALVAVILPPGLLGSLVSPGPGQLLLMVLAGLPLYMCSTASVPLAYALLLQGVSPGAALVFLMCGPATNTTAISVIGATLGWRTLLIFLFSIISVALASGYLLDALWPQALTLGERLHSTPEGLALWAEVSGGLLLGLVFWHLALKLKARLRKTPSCSCQSSCCSSRRHSD